MSEPLPAAPTAGSLLRAAREGQGLHIAALAAAIKVTPRKLDALENDRWDELPDATFTRALALTVCRSLKIDPQPVLALLPAVSELSLEPSGNAMNTPFRERPGRDDPVFGSAAIRPMAWAGVVLMLAAVAVYFVPATEWMGAAEPVAAPPASSEVTVPVPAELASAAIAVAASEPAGSAALPAQPDVRGAWASEPARLAEAAAPAAAVAGAASPPVAPQAGLARISSAPTGPAAAAPVIATTPAATSPAVALPDKLVVLRSSAPSWVDVRDGRGQVLLSRVVQAGESVGLDGSLPIRLTIGNAAGVQLSFKGQAVELGSRTRENVARVELP